MSASSTAIRVLSALLVVSAAAFAVGVAIERSQHTERAERTAAVDGAETSAETATASEPPASTATGESSGESGSETGAGSGATGEGSAEPAATVESGAPEASPEASATHTEQGETLFGISTESTGLVALAVVASLLLAVLLWARGAVPVLLVAALLVGVVFAAFDLREAFHQADLSNTGLVVTAIVVAILHGAVAVAAARLLAQGRAAARAVG